MRGLPKRLSILVIHPMSAIEKSSQLQLLGEGTLEVMLALQIITVINNTVDGGKLLRL